VHSPSPAASARQTAIDSVRLRPQVAAFCGDCHALPGADRFPREAWRHEVERGFAFYAESGRHDMAVPPLEDVVAYFESQAPDQLEVQAPAGNSARGNAPLLFETVASPAPELEPPAVSSLGWMALPHREELGLVFCDMRSGLVGALRHSPSGLSVENLATLKHPARVSLCNLDGYGGNELLVAELGSFTSEDHSRGAVVWLRWDGEQGVWQQRLLQSGLGRVADVRPGDFDGDGDEDLVVAEFGHLYTGRVLLYENTAIVCGVPQLKEHVVDERHGAIHVPTADLNGDGRLDFVALLSQEHEVVVAYLNSGGGKFERQTLFAAGDPANGSSGIELLDLDRDDDLDVLYCNGDTFGSAYFKPYQGIHWLENRGAFPFFAHKLTGMIGVQAVATADLDGDSDTDIVAGAFMPPQLVARPELTAHDSLVWLEQTEPGRFQRHGLERGNFVHAALAPGDLDGDGNLDLAVGVFQDLRGRHLPWLTFWNRVKR